MPQKANRPAFSCAQASIRGGGVRVKGWGKSPPRDWQQDRQGKPHREQDRIGMTRVPLAVLQPVSGPVIRVGCVRQRANAVPDEWLPRSGKPGPYRTRLTGQLAISSLVECYLWVVSDSRDPGCPVNDRWFSAISLSGCWQPDPRVLAGPAKTNDFSCLSAHGSVIFRVLSRTRKVPSLTLC